MILDQCVPLFNALLSSSNSPPRLLVNKICEVLRAGAHVMHTSLAPLLEVYMSYLDALMFSYPAPASELAKSVYLVPAYFINYIEMTKYLEVVQIIARSLEKRPKMHYFYNSMMIICKKLYHFLIFNN